MTPTQRLARLERRCRWLTATVAGLATVVLAMLLVAAQRPSSEEVRTKRLVIVDEDGREIGRWTDWMEGSRASFYDDKGTERVYIYSDARGAGVHLESANGLSRCYLIERPDQWGMKVFSHGRKNHEGGGLFVARGFAKCWIHADSNPDDGSPGGYFGASIDGMGLDFALGHGGREIRIRDSDVPLTLSHEAGGETTATLDLRKAIDQLKSRK
jgi:hypothetical protein